MTFIEVLPGGNKSGAIAINGSNLLLQDNGSGINNITIKAGDGTTAVTTHTLIFPPDIGSAGTALIDTLGDGILSWSTGSLTPGGADTQIQFNNSGSFGGSSNLTWDGSLIGLTGAITASGIITTDTSLKIKETAGDDTHYITIQAPDSIAADYTLTLPVDDGASGEFLTTDGSGVLSWNGGISYATGTWTPVLSTGTIVGVVDGTANITNISASYIRINAICHLKCNIVYLSAGTIVAGSPIIITGLPFTTTNVAFQIQGVVEAAAWAGLFFATNNSFSTNVVNVYSNGAVNNFFFQSTPTTTAATPATRNLIGSDLHVNKSIALSLTYFCTF